jgi:hypothetical protein
MGSSGTSPNAQPSGCSHYCANSSVPPVNLTDVCVNARSRHWPG